MRQNSFTPWLATAVLAAALACYGNSKKDAVPEDLLPSEWSSDAPGAKASDPSIADPNVGEDGEICDGWDNDVDGEVDEGTGGGPCTPSWNSSSPAEELIYRCLAGDLICTECEPGAERTADCGCNIVRVDNCNEVGRWNLGVCDGCELPPVVCECTPGETRTERCDVCLEEGCGTTCVGSTWECNADCEWEQVGGCQIMLAECDRDQILEEDCGHCGTRVTTCDGCFWQLGPCEEQGECAPGDEKKIPCLEGSGACLDGYVATIDCNEYCEWEQDRPCRGCSLGSARMEEEPCEPDAAAAAAAGDMECGTQTVAYACEESSTYSICDDTIAIVQGRISENGVPIDECTPAECGVPGNGNGNPGDGDGDGTPSGGGGDVCVPGTTQLVNCVTTSGLCGVAEVPCEDGSWADPEICIEDPDACEPGEQETEEVSCGNDACGMTYTLVRTCTVRNGVCSWSSDRSDRRDACPDCDEGETQRISCTTPQGQCGTRTAVCNSQCLWDDGVCEPLPDACSPGAERSTSFSCGENTCGIQYQIVERCDGCNWDVVSSNKNQVCPDCQTGETRASSQMCRPGFPECGYVPLICNQSCVWAEGTCPPCG